MRNISLLFIVFLSAIAAGAQPPERLATAKGLNFTTAELSPRGQAAYAAIPKQIAEIRSALLSEYLADLLFEAEAKARNISVEALRTETLKKVADPSAAEIQQIYDANRAALGNRPLDEVRQTIIDFLRREPEQKAMQELVTALQKKHQLTKTGDVNTSSIAVSNVLARLGTRTITNADFEKAVKTRLDDSLAHVYDDFQLFLEDELLSSLINVEAKERNMDASSLIAAEITNKMREFSDEERIDLEDKLRRTLYKKYDVRFVYKRPAPVKFDISTTGKPVLGNENAKVTVVMFSDFQCPACARTHPVLKRVLKEYGDNVKLVVRDFPLENIHENALSAARAANAAAKQGKYWEFIELLYSNQDALDAASLKRYAEQLGLDLKQFETDALPQTRDAEIRKDQADGMSFGVGGTPTIFVNGVKVHRLSAPAFRDAIEAALLQ
ncbi:MAG: DsbA family protein [Acidobacteria bacterium]|nr:DsbA family protein [Acidobacteriota bacterium]